MRRIYFLLVILLAAATLTACGSNPSSPSSSSTVEINGSIVAASGSIAAGGLSARTMSVAQTVPADLRVSVAGTNISALVDARGQFKLKNVPPGNVELRFSTNTSTVSISLTDLQTGQTVTITVSLSGSSAVVESERRSSGSEEQLEGRVESLPPTTAAGALVVAGRTVTTNDATRFYLGGALVTFARLEIGQRVHVKGQTSGLSLLASVVDIQNTNTSVGLNANGVVTDFTGTRDNFQFKVDGKLIKGDGLTEFYGNSQFNELANGQTVEVKGSQRDGFVYATRIHVNVEDIEFSGVITAKSGTGLDLTLTIAGKTVKTSAETEVRRKGDVQDVSSLYIGQTVEVTGPLVGGSVIARKITIVADSPGGTFLMSGSMGSLSGSCATSLSFSVSGYQITTNALTTFTPNCNSLSNGSKVEVKGTVQADLSVVATSVKKQ